MQSIHLESITAGPGYTVLRVAGEVDAYTFRVTGLIRVFALHPSIADAIAGDAHWQTALAREGRSAAEWCRDHQLA